MKRVTRKLFHYPAARRADVVEDYHGTAVSDPYRWLEDPDSDETKAFVTQQNELTQSYLAEMPNRATLQERLTQLWDYPKYQTPEKKGDHTFFLHNDGLQNQSVLYQKLESDTSAVVLDPNKLSEDGTLAMTMHTFSKDGRFLAYSLSQSGSDWQEIHLLDVENGTKFDETIKYCKFTSVAWTDDNAGFYYARYPSPEEMPDALPSTHQRVYYHQLGTAQSEDKLIYARPDAPEMGFFPTVTDNGRYLILTVWESTARLNRIYYRDLETESEFVRLLDDMDGEYLFLGNDDATFYFQTDLGAPNGRFIAIDIDSPDRANWQELISENSDAVAFSQIVHDKFVVARLHHGHHKLHIYALDGTHIKEISLPTIGSIGQLSGRRQDSDLFIQFFSFLAPPTILRYDFNVDDLETVKQPHLNFDAAQYETIQVFYPSKDGTQIPLFLTYKKGLALDGNNPTLLYGYGGFHINMTPIFSPTRLAWVEQGGIYAQACLRGGGEYGEAWHKAGMMGNKQNVFDDFIAAGEWLIKEGYTRNGRLAIEGRSNGGLLVAACLLQRPDLFGAVHCGVPVIDMYRYQKFTAGRYWTSEYGNAIESEADFHTMRAYSPLHNVKTAVTHPPTLITTAESDDRVVPMHAEKFAASLQAADPGINPLLVRIETKAGHGLGKPTHKLIEEATDIYSFLWTTLINQ